MALTVLIDNANLEATHIQGSVLSSKSYDFFKAIAQRYENMLYIQHTGQKKVYRV